LKLWASNFNFGQEKWYNLTNKPEILRDI